MAVMILRNKNFSLLSLLLISALIYFLWMEFKPVKIIAIHQQDNFSDVLVNNFPITDNGKIAWWMKNKNMLSDKYKIPKPASDGFFTITFWDFGDGYQEEGKYDRLCFDDMKTAENCIDKNSLMIIRNSQYNVMSFTLDSGIYQLKNGEIVKMKHE